MVLVSIDERPKVISGPYLMRHAGFGFVMQREHNISLRPACWKDRHVWNGPVATTPYGGRNVR